MRMLAATCAALAVLFTAVPGLADSKGWVQKTKETKAAEKEMERWKGLAETDCKTKFDVWFDLKAYDGYAYEEDYPRERLLGTGYLGLVGTNFFNEMRGACRTFMGNEPTTCVPKLKPFKKIVFRGHPKLHAKNTDVDLIAEGDALIVVYPPNIQWQTELIAKTFYEKFECSGSEALDSD